MTAPWGKGVRVVKVIEPLTTSPDMAQRLQTDPTLLERLWRYLTRTP